jgi:hypothetical protein
MERNYYIYPVRLCKRSLYLIWFCNSFDGLYINNEGRIIAFPRRDQAEAFIHSQRHSVVQSNTPLLDFDLLDSWLQAPMPEGVDCQAFTSAWNLFGDLCSSLNQRNMDTEDNQYIDVYRKLFSGLNLPTMVEAGKHYIPTWTNEDIGDLVSALSHKLSDFKRRILIVD